MKCPMLTMYALSFKTPEEFKDRDCLKGKCAWWDEQLEQCSIISVIYTLWLIRGELSEIRVKLFEWGGTNDAGS